MMSVFHTAYGLHIDVSECDCMCECVNNKPFISGPAACFDFSLKLVVVFVVVAAVTGIVKTKSHKEQNLCPLCHLYTKYTPSSVHVCSMFHSL